MSISCKVKEILIDTHGHRFYCVCGVAHGKGFIAILNHNIVIECDDKHFIPEHLFATFMERNFLGDGKLPTDKKTLVGIAHTLTDKLVPLVQNELYEDVFLAE